MWPLLLRQTGIGLLEKNVVLLIFGQTSWLHVCSRLSLHDGHLTIGGLAVLVDLEVAYELYLVLRELLGAYAVRRADRRMLAHLIRTPDRQQLCLRQLIVLPHMANLTLICCRPRHLLYIMKRVLQVFLAL